MLAPPLFERKMSQFRKVLSVKPLLVVKKEDHGDAVFALDKKGSTT
jgi:hypothetical protein